MFLWILVLPVLNFDYLSSQSLIGGDTYFSVKKRGTVFTRQFSTDKTETNCLTIKDWLVSYHLVINVWLLNVPSIRQFKL